MSLHLHSTPSVRVFIESEEHSLFGCLRQMLFQGSNKFLSFFLPSCFIQNNGSYRFRIHRSGREHFTHLGEIISIGRFIGSRDLFTRNCDQIQILQDTSGNTCKLHTVFLCFKNFFILLQSFLMEIGKGIFL